MHDETTAIFKQLYDKAGTPAEKDLLVQAFYSDFEKTGSELIDYPQIMDGFYFVDLTGKKPPRPDYDGLADYMSEAKYLYSDESVIYFYKDGYFKSVGNLMLQKIIKGFVRKNTSPAILQQFAKASLIHTQTDFSELKYPKGLLNLSNGVLSTRTRSLKDHNPKYFFKYKLNHDFDLEAKCPVFLNSLNLVTNGDKDLQRLIQQVFGYCIEGGVPKAQKAFLFYGEGGNGKSTILNALTRLIGEANVSHVSLEYFDKPFSMISLDGKLANIVEETPKKNINPEAFKNVVTGGYVRAAHKNKPEFDLRVNARVVFACNSLPKFGDASDGLRRRLVVIPFMHKFTDALADRNIDHKIGYEMSGILNWALDGLADLKANEYRFHLSSAVDEAVEEYKRETDSVYDFLTEHAYFSECDGANTSTKDAYKKYKSFCMQGGNQPCAVNEFGRRATAVFERMYLENDLILSKNDRMYRVMGSVVRGIKRVVVRSPE